VVDTPDGKFAKSEHGLLLFPLLSNHGVLSQEAITLAIIKKRFEEGHTKLVFFVRHYHKDLWIYLARLTQSAQWTQNGKSSLIPIVCGSLQGTRSPTGQFRALSRFYSQKKTRKGAKLSSIPFVGGHLSLDDYLIPFTKQTPRVMNAIKSTLLSVPNKWKASFKYNQQNQSAIAQVRPLHLIFA